jgi:hypothetical protein
MRRNCEKQQLQTVEHACPRPTAAEQLLKMVKHGSYWEQLHASGKISMHYNFRSQSRACRATAAPCHCLAPTLLLLLLWVGQAQLDLKEVTIDQLDTRTVKTRMCPLNPSGNCLGALVSGYIRASHQSSQLRIIAFCFSPACCDQTLS